MTPSEMVVRSVYPDAEIREVATGVYRVFTQPSGFVKGDELSFTIGLTVGASCFQDTVDKWKNAADSINFNMMRKLLS